MPEKKTGFGPSNNFSPILDSLNIPSLIINIDKVHQNIFNTQQQFQSQPQVYPTLPANLTGVPGSSTNLVRENDGSILEILHNFKETASSDFRVMCNIGKSVMELYNVWDFYKQQSKYLNIKGMLVALELIQIDQPSPSHKQKENQLEKEKEKKNMAQHKYDNEMDTEELRQKDPLALTISPRSTSTGTSFFPKPQSNVFGLRSATDSKSRMFNLTGGFSMKKRTTCQRNADIIEGFKKSGSELRISGQGKVFSKRTLKKKEEKSLLSIQSGVKTEEMDEDLGKFELKKGEGGKYEKQLKYDARIPMAMQNSRTMGIRQTSTETFQTIGTFEIEGKNQVPEYGIRKTPLPQTEKVIGRRDMLRSASSNKSINSSHKNNKQMLACRSVEVFSNDLEPKPRFLIFSKKSLNKTLQTQNKPPYNQWKSINQIPNLLYSHDLL